MADLDLQISREGWGGGEGRLYGEVPWLPLEKNIFLFRLQVRMGRDFARKNILKSTENQKG